MFVYQMVNGWKIGSDSGGFPLNKTVTFKNNLGVSLDRHSTAEAPTETFDTFLVSFHAFRMRMTVVSVVLCPY